MWKKIFIVALISGFINVGCDVYAKKKQETGEAKGKFTETVYDFGAIKENGGSVSHNFELVNEGNAPLVIYDATAECGCTKPTYPKKPIAAGKKDMVKVTYNPMGRPGSFEKTVTVKTNGNPRKLRIKIRGSVIPKAKK